MEKRRPAVISVMVSLPKSTVAFPRGAADSGGCADGANDGGDASVKLGQARCHLFALGKGVGTGHDAEQGLARSTTLPNAKLARRPLPASAGGRAKCRASERIPALP